MATPQQIAQAMRYGPTVQRQLRRSEYLDDALKSLASSGGENIRSPYELAAKLAGVAILNRGANKAQDAAVTGLRAAKDERVARMLAGLPDMSAPPQAPVQAPPPAPAPQVAPPPQMQVPPQPEPVAQAPLPPAAPNIGDLAWQANVQQESAGDGNAIGQPTRSGRALGSTQMLPATAQAMAQKLGLPWRPEWLVGNTPEELDYQNQLGRAYFDEGLQKYGGDPVKAAMYYHGGPNEREWGPKTQAHARAVMAKMARLGGGQSGPPAQMQGGAGADRIAPEFNFDASAIPPGADLTQLPPSAPESSPPVAGAPPAALPQAAAGGMPPSMQQPTVAEVSLIKRLMTSQDPEEQARGEALYWKLQERMTQPVEWDVKVQDGMVIATNPMNPSQRVVQPIPELQYQRKGAQELGVPAPQGTTFNVSPQGKTDPLYAPPQGYQSGPAGQSMVQGGPAAMETERQLRTDFEKAPEYRAFARSAAIFDSMKQQFGTAGRVADINFVYGLATIFDPDSVVREGEQVVIRNSQSLPDWVVGQINRVNGGQGILPETRAQMLESAGSRVVGMQQQIQSRADFSRGLAERYGIDPRNVIPPLPEFEAWKRPEGMGAAPGSPGTAAQYPAAVTKAHQNMLARGQYDAKAPLGSEKRPFLAPDDAAVKAVDTPANKGKFIILPNGDTARID